jgi:hypothetical protein
LPGVLWTTWWPYALDKTIRFFSLTLLAAVAPVYLVTTARAFRAFTIGFLVVGIILCVSAGLSLL